MPPRHVVLAVTVAVLWGVNFLAIHASLEQFPPLFLVALRFALTAVPTLILVPRPRVPWRWLVGYGLGFGTLQFLFLYLGMAAGFPTGLSSLVLQASAPFTVVLGTLLLRERLGARRLIGVGVATAGLAVVGLSYGAAAPSGALDERGASPADARPLPRRRGPGPHRRLPLRLARRVRDTRLDRPGLHRPARHAAGLGHLGVADGASSRRRRRPVLDAGAGGRHHHRVGSAGRGAGGARARRRSARHPRRPVGLAARPRRHGPRPMHRPAHDEARDPRRDPALADRRGLGRTTPRLAPPQARRPRRPPHAARA